MFLIIIFIIIQILIEATVGPGASGDIAIDDISIKNGICQASTQKATVAKRIGKIQSNVCCI